MKMSKLFMYAEPFSVRYRSSCLQSEARSFLFAAWLKKMIGRSANTFGRRGAFLCFFFDLFVLADAVG